MVSTPASDGAASGPIPTEAQRAASDVRAAAFGRVMALLMASPRHSAMTLSEASAYVTPALALGQIAMMGAQQADSGPMALAAAAWWAFVSPEVDQRLSESREPHLKLASSEWKCGDQPWVIDTIGDPRLVNELVKRLAVSNFKGKPAKLRAFLPDGRIAVGRLEPKPAQTEQTNA
ncbi:MAG: toxin-activating lysine-acyltransferase [Hyphomicrobium sp.]